MSTSDLALSVEHVKKKYRIGVLGSTTLRAELQTRWALAHGKEDPNSIVGSSPQQKGKEFYALDDVSFQVKKGERLGIIGANGAGKSTLLKLICRITSPTEGYIGHNGRVTSMLEVGMGFNGELTGRENIYLNGSILGMSRKEIDEHIEEIIDFSEVGHFIDTPVKRYSSGMYVRLGFATAAHLNADIVIMDEVLAVGDIGFQEKCIARMREIAENDNKTILYVSHNMFTVHSLCDRCLVLNKGKLIYDGSVSEAEQIYRENLKAESHKSLKNQERKWNNDQRATFLSCDFPSENYTVKDTMETLLRWRYDEDTDDVHLRLEIWDQTNRAVGSKIFYHLGGGKAGEEKEGRFTIDTSHLRNGRYRSVYVLFRIDSAHENNPLDRAEGLVFEIDDPAREEELIWHRDWWGSAML